MPLRNYFDVPQARLWMCRPLQYCVSTAGFAQSVCLKNQGTLHVGLRLVCPDVQLLDPPARVLRSALIYYPRTFTSHIIHIRLVLEL